MVPGRDGKLTGDNCGAAAVTVFEYLEKIMACLFIERLQAPIVQYQELNVTKGALKPGIPAIAVSESEIGEQARYTLIENRPIIPAGFMPKRPGQPTFADAGLSADCAIVASIDPVAADQLQEQRPLETPLAAITDILWHGVMAKLGEPQASGKFAISNATSDRRRLAADGLDRPVGNATIG